MLFLKNIPFDSSILLRVALKNLKGDKLRASKKTIFFFTLFAFFIFFPFQKADAYCGDGAVEPGLGEQCDDNNLKNIIGIETNGIDLASRGYHTCAVNTSGNVYCWGGNNYGQLGDGTVTFKTKPNKVLNEAGSGYLSNITSIASGKAYTCALDSKGNVFCWGENTFGQLGDNTGTNRTTPVQVHGVGNVGYLSNIKSISAGFNHTCAVDIRGDAYCWGLNEHGQLGDGTTTQSLIPVQVLGVGGSGFLANIKSISAGGGGGSKVDGFGGFTCAVDTTSGNAYCWGANEYGQLGDNTTKQSLTPVQVHDVGNTGYLFKILGISTGWISTCAYNSNGDAYCWGYNYYGELGDNTTKQSLVPVQVLGVGGSGFLANVAGISTGEFSTCTYTIYGEAYCWGNNADGQLGDSTTITRYTPVQVHGVGNVGYLSKISGISIDGFRFASTCAYNTNGDAYCWGANKDAQLGKGGGYGPSSTPVRPMNPDNGLACTAAYGSSCTYCSTSCLNVTIYGPRCGDNILQLTDGEKCDGAVLNGETCTTQGFTGGTLVCNATCNGYNTSQCYACGDNIKNGTEICDGTDLNSQTCITQGYSGGTLACDGFCNSFKTANCYRCGDGNINPGEQCDGSNLGTATCTTQGFTGGTLSCSICAFSTSQCYTCGDGVINSLETCDQGSGNVANGDGCNSTCQVENGYSCTGAPSVCALNCGNGNLDAGEMCDPNNAGSKTLACVDANSYNGAQTCLANCSGYGACVATESCGDSIKNGNELCDTSTNTCAINSYQGTQNCVMTGANPCKSFAACVPTESCGDSVLNGTETCDQGSGNVANGDGCNSTCQVENGYSCTGAPSVCALNCGNGNLDAGEMCDPSHTGTATASCTTATGYPGTQSCLLNCTGYGACASTLSCGDGIFTNPPETCDGDTRSCTTSVNGYNGTQTCTATTCNGYNTCASTEFCGDHIKNGDEECDYDAGTTKVNGDGCSTDCKVEEGYTCYNDPGTTPPNKNVCVFSCGNEILQSVAPFNEECDYGAAPVNPPQLGDRGGDVHGPYNGDICTPTYGVPCAWCSTDCKNQTVLGEYCGDGRVNGTEYCDDGNFDNGDGCSACEDGGDFGSETKDGNIGCANGCQKEFGFVCEGFPFSTCKTQCGDGQCAGGTAETCVNCPGDCGMCSIGQRPGVSAVHDRGVFTSLFDKIKTFIFQPQPVIQIPGMNLGQTKIQQEYILPPPPVSTDYEIGQPTMTKIGDEYYTITVQTVNTTDGSVSFTVR